MSEYTNEDALVRDSASGWYVANAAILDEDIIVAAAIEILQRRMFRTGALIDSVADARNYVRVALAGRLSEVFCVAFLDTRQRVLAFEEMFAGTIDGAAVYPREVVRRVLFHNAKSVILVHNHPSGLSDPSDADKGLTVLLQNALGLIGVKVLDHFIVGGAEVYSFVEHGLIG